MSLTFTVPLQPDGSPGSPGLSLPASSSSWSFVLVISVYLFLLPPVCPSLHLVTAHCFQYSVCRVFLTTSQSTESPPKSVCSTLTSILSSVSTSPWCFSPSHFQSEVLDVFLKPDPCLTSSDLSLALSSCQSPERGCRL